MVIFAAGEIVTDSVASDVMITASPPRLNQLEIVMITFFAADPMSPNFAWLLLVRVRWCLEVFSEVDKQSKRAVSQENAAQRNN